MRLRDKITSALAHGGVGREDAMRRVAALDGRDDVVDSVQVQRSGHLVAQDSSYVKSRDSEGDAGSPGKDMKNVNRRWESRQSRM